MTRAEVLALTLERLTSFHVTAWTEALITAPTVWTVTS